MDEETSMESPENGDNMERVVKSGHRGDQQEVESVNNNGHGVELQDKKK